MVGGRCADRREASLLAPSGRIQLASVASPGEVLFSPPGAGAGPPGGRLCAPGPAGALAGWAPRRQRQWGRDRCSSEAAACWSTDRQIFADTLGNVHGASLGLDLRVAADAVIHDSDLRASPFGAGNGGNIVMNVGRLALTDGGRHLQQQPWCRSWRDVNCCSDRCDQHHWAEQPGQSERAVQ